MISALSSVALVIGYGSLLCTLVLGLCALVCSVRDQLRADEWAQERERAEQYESCDSYARPSARVLAFRRCPGDPGRSRRQS